MALALEPLLSLPEPPEIPVKVLAQNSLTSYRHKTQLLYESGDTSLYEEYQARAAQALTTRFTPDTTTGRILGAQGLQHTFNLYPGTLSQTLTHIHLQQQLLQPLLVTCRDLASFYGIAPDDPETILTALHKQGDLNPAFIDDLRAAYRWALTHCQTLASAWRSEDPPIGLKPDEISLKPPEKELSTAQQAFYLNSTEQHKLRMHYQRTVGLLAQTYHHWQADDPLQPGFDPLAQWCKDIMMQLTSGVLLPEDAQQNIERLAQAVVHRPAIGQTTWHSTIFLGWPQKLQIAYVKILDQKWPYGKKNQPESLPQRLRHLPTPSGRRVVWAEKQVEWEEQGYRIYGKPHPRRKLRKKLKHPMPKMKKQLYSPLAQQ